MPPRPIVTATRRLPDAVESALRERFDARFPETDRPMRPGELAAALRDSDGLLPTVTDAITAELLGAEQVRARILANFGVGVNHIDLDAARSRGIVVTNTPDVLTDDTADLAIALMLMVARRLGEGERELRDGRWAGWRPTHLMGRTLRGMRLGIIGYGRIGRAVAERATRAFGMRVRYVSGSRSRPPAPDESGLAEPAESLEALLAESDIVSLHCPLTPETHHLMNSERLALMRREAILINTARGPVVDEAALVAALRAGRLFGAGLDVYEREPAVPDELRAMENVVLLPHLGSATMETRVAMGMRAVDNLTACLAGDPPPDRVA
ncbi:MAG TPA: D-glycerate dehydrogenase [Gemmatimonadaceae bacterium]|nr:D-glycerate dehydrogenase [Gemmatimonadaceae bacterium]